MIVVDALLSSRTMVAGTVRILMWNMVAGVDADVCILGVVPDIHDVLTF